MLFNSFRFVVFFVGVTAVYFALPHRWRWALLLAASCAFYMFFVPVYILILFATIVIDYFAGLWIEGTDDPVRKKRYLALSVLSVCAILFVFKYFNFFNQNVAAIARAVGWNYGTGALRLILPIGLSFHTFQSLSYVIEVYRGRQRAERHFGMYALYVMYFPQLVAGPIERPQNVLPQLHREQNFDPDRARDGLALALWGLFKKVVIADSLAIYVDAAYGAAAHHNGTTLLVATYFFAIQIYCDFSGYSDIARGISKVYGIELMKNFATPYFATSIAEFWSRWHISLSTWFRDYVYVPLGGNRVSRGRNLVNLLVVFLLSGLWHGANWTFVVWGALNGVYLVVERLLGASDRKPARARGLWQTLPRMALTFHLVLLSWVFFRADDVHTAFVVLRKIALEPGRPFWDPVLAQGALGIGAVVLLEAMNRGADYWIDARSSRSRLRVPYALALIFVIVLFGIDRGTQFIYFQF